MKKNIIKKLGMEDEFKKWVKSVRMEIRKGDKVKIKQLSDVDDLYVRCMKDHVGTIREVRDVYNNSDSGKLVSLWTPGKGSHWVYHIFDVKKVDK